MSNTPMSNTPMSNTPIPQPQFDFLAWLISLFFSLYNNIPTTAKPMTNKPMTNKPMNNKSMSNIPISLQPQFNFLAWLLSLFSWWSSDSTSQVIKPTAPPKTIYSTNPPRHFQIDNELNIKALLNNYITDLNTKYNEEKNEVNEINEEVIQDMVTIQNVNDSVNEPNTIKSFENQIIKNNNSNRCMSSTTNTTDGKTENVQMIERCNANDTKQQWTYDGKLIKSIATNKCLDGGGTQYTDINGKVIYLNPNCDPKNPYQQWKFTGKGFKNVQTGMCLDGGRDNGKTVYSYSGCDPNNTWQQWNINYPNKDNIYVRLFTYNLLFVPGLNVLEFKIEQLGYKCGILASVIDKRNGGILFNSDENWIFTDNIVAPTIVKGKPAQDYNYKYQESNMEKLQEEILHFIEEIIDDIEEDIEQGFTPLNIAIIVGIILVIVIIILCVIYIK